jgi:hypothetical protein
MKTVYKKLKYYKLDPEYKAKYNDLLKSSNTNSEEKTSPVKIFSIYQSCLTRKASKSCDNNINTNIRNPDTAESDFLSRSALEHSTTFNNTNNISSISINISNPEIDLIPGDSSNQSKNLNVNVSNNNRNNYNLEPSSSSTTTCSSSISSSQSFSNESNINNSFEYRCIITPTSIASNLLTGEHLYDNNTSIIEDQFNDEIQLNNLNTNDMNKSAGVGACGTVPVLVFQTEIDDSTKRKIDEKLRECSSTDSDSDSEQYNYAPKGVDLPSAQRLAKRLYYLDGFKASDIARHLSKK